MKYKPRLTAPAKNNKHYYSNDNVFYRGGFGMPNCTAYAHGRIAEITGKYPRIYGNAEDWYSAAQKNGYETGASPKLGAIICWKAGRTGNGADGAGHVAVVEQIKPNGDIVVSASAWKSTEFYLTPLTKESGYIYDSTRPLLGFIYCGIEFDPETGDTVTENGAAPAAGKKVLLKDTPCYSSETAATSYGKKSGTYFLWDSEVRNGRVRITNSAARVGKAGQVTCWINAADAGLDGVAPVQPAEELERQPEAGAKPEVKTESEVKAEPAAAQGGSGQTAEPKASYQCIHTVKAGDSLWGLAKRYLGKGSLYAEIAKLNGLKSTTILVGQELKIPNR